MTLDKENVASLFQPGSSFFQHNPKFELRNQQLKMLELIIEAYNQKSFALIEAGTGTGKSLAYLIPTILDAHQNQKKSVISTHTITLQEQLLKKDIPEALKSMGIDLEVVLVKGMGNYLCLRKLYDLCDHASIYNLEEQEELSQLESWSRETTEGSYSDLEAPPKKLSWDKVNCESDACSFVKCPHYSSCFFFKARKACKDADILIANHHLLMADLQMAKQDSASSILPEYDNLIIDEAHSLEDIATQSLANSLSASYLLRKVNEIISDRGKTGKIQRLQKLLIEYAEEADSTLTDKVHHQAFDEKRVLQTCIIEAFGALSDFLSTQSQDQEGKLALQPQARLSSDFQNTKESFQALKNQLEGYGILLDSIGEEALKLSPTELQKKASSILIDLRALSFFLSKAVSLIDQFFNSEVIENTVYTLEWNHNKSLSAVRMMIIRLNVAETLANFLFEPRSSAILCSATLTHNREFSFIKQHLGFNESCLQDRQCFDLILDSPFDFENKVLLTAPTDISAPSSPQFSKQAIDYIFEMVKISHGGAFILFTSFKLLKECYDQICQPLIELGLLPLKQGEDSRNNLLYQFKQSENAVLFGTDTFWEGIDVPGFNLRLVIITKLPFPVPSEPIFKAKCDELERKGKNPFYEYSVPKAVVKFKQGFGRLIRTKNDYGCIACLDSRIVQKAYGKIFLNSLPGCKRVFGGNGEIKKELDILYQTNGA